MLAKLREAREEENGFTLVELLVVIIIIGILAGIAIPAFLNQRQRANDGVTQSDVKNAITTMESALIGDDTYPTTLPPETVKSDGVTLTLFGASETTGGTVGSESGDLTVAEATAKAAPGSNEANFMTLVNLCSDHLYVVGGPMTSDPCEIELYANWTGVWFRGSFGNMSFFPGDDLSWIADRLGYTGDPVTVPFVSPFAAAPATGGTAATVVANSFCITGEHVNGTKAFHYDSAVGGGVLPGACA